MQLGVTTGNHVADLLKFGERSGKCRANPEPRPVFRQGVETGWAAPVNRMRFMVKGQSRPRTPYPYGGGESRSGTNPGAVGSNPAADTTNPCQSHDYQIPGRMVPALHGHISMERVTGTETIRVPRPAPVRSHAGRLNASTVLVPFVTDMADDRPALQAYLTRNAQRHRAWNACRAGMTSRMPSGWHSCTNCHYTGSMPVTMKHCDILQPVVIMISKTFTITSLSIYRFHVHFLNGINF